MQLSKILQITTTDEWELRANKVLSNFPIQYPDEIDIYEICRKYGVIIKPLDKHYFDEDFDYDDTVDAFSVPKPKGRRGLIYIKPELDPIEKKLLLAEEFCHCYAHHISQVGADEVLIGKTEAQAKRMAAYLLMPAKFMGHVYSAAADELVLVSDIADYFTVSEEFAKYRLELIFNRNIDGFTKVRNRVGSFEWFE